LSNDARFKAWAMSNSARFKAWALSNGVRFKAWALRNGVRFKAWALNKVPGANTNWGGAGSSSTSQKPLMIKGFLGIEKSVGADLH